MNSWEQSTMRANSMTINLSGYLEMYVGTALAGANAGSTGT
jgi:hypothetical protein